jgi:hypothetical protein
MPETNTSSEQHLDLADLLSIPESLGTVACDVSIFDINEIKSCIDPASQLKLISSLDNDAYGKWVDVAQVSDDGSFVLHSTEESPKILFEGSASFCSLVFSLDQEGNALLFHYPVIGNGGKISENPELSGELSRYKSKLSEMKEAVSIITGTNVSGLLQKKVVNFLKSSLGSHFNVESMFLRKKGFSKFLFNQLFDLVRMRLTNREVELNNHYIHGVLIIPKQFTKDRRSKCFILTDQTGYTFEGLLKAMVNNSS